jgi:hypothetical protein
VSAPSVLGGDAMNDASERTRSAVTRWCLGVCVVALLLVGCGSKTTDGGSSVDINSAPRTESPSTEAAQSGETGIAITVASLPIGGNTDGSGAEQCADVGPTNVPDPFPSDVSVSVAGFSLDPVGIFRFGGNPAACGDLAREPVCPSAWTWAAGTLTRCLVIVTQVADPTDDVTVTLNLGGTVRCAKQSACDAITHAGHSQIGFTAHPGVVSTGGGPSTSGGGESS